jgi:hypothetical protein
VDLLDDLQRHIQAFVAGDYSVDDLHFELAEYVQQIADSEDVRARALFGRAFSLISEYGYGHRTEQSARDELRTSIGETLGERQHAQV